MRNSISLMVLCLSLCSCNPALFNCERPVEQKVLVRNTPIRVNQCSDIPVAKESFYDRSFSMEKCYGGVVYDSVQAQKESQQEAEVQEMDRVVESSDRVFVARDNSIEVIDKLGKVGVARLQLGAVRRPRLFITPTNLIAVSLDGPRYSLYSNYDNTKTIIHSFDLTQSTPTLRTKKELSGSLVGARVANDKLILAVRSHWDSPGSSNPSDIPCDALVVEPNFTGGMTGLHAIDISSFNTESVGFLGRYSDLYMTNHAIYLIQGEIGGAFGGIRYVETAKLKTSLRVIQTPGRVRSRWALKELEDGKYLSVVSSNVFASWGNSASSNQLDIFDLSSNQPQIVSSVSGFGVREEVKGVRYVDNKAYIVTFRRTDPLHVIDLADPKNPKMIAELEVPGFSDYLQKLDSTTLLGVGYNTTATGAPTGIQISLFDISNPATVFARQILTLGAPGSFSEVVFDPHALFHDKATQLVGVPLVQIASSYSQSFPAGRLEFSGAYLYQFNQKLTATAQISHSDIIPYPCLEHMGRTGFPNGTQTLDISRLARIGDDVWSISNFGIKVHPLANLSSATSRLQFPNGATECSALMSW